MKVWIEKPISELPEKEGRFYVTGGLCGKDTCDYSPEFGWLCSKDYFTHYLVLIEANELIENNIPAPPFFKNHAGKFQFYYKDVNGLNQHSRQHETLEGAFSEYSERKLLTDEELEKKISDAWDAGGRSTYDSIQPEGACGFDHKQHSSDKTEYLKQLNNG